MRQARMVLAMLAVALSALCEARETAAQSVANAAPGYESLWSCINKERRQKWTLGVIGDKICPVFGFPDDFPTGLCQPIQDTGMVKGSDMRVQLGDYGWVDCSRSKYDRFGWLEGSRWACDYTWPTRGASGKAEVQFRNGAFQSDRGLIVGSALYNGHDYHLDDTHQPIFEGVFGRDSVRAHAGGLQIRTSRYEGGAALDCSWAGRSEPGLVSEYLNVAAGGVRSAGSQSSAPAKKGPEISVADDPSMKKGTPEVVLVEISDFQCPFCGTTARHVLPRVREELVRTGKVELIHLDFPLEKIHAHAFKAAEAAACAGDQKMFWDMHDSLFANQQAVLEGRLTDHAKELGLDAAVFQECLSSGRHAAGIREDMRTVELLGVTGTPSYLFGRRLPDSDKIQVLEIVGGTQSYESIREKLTAFIASE